MTSLLIQLFQICNQANNSFFLCRFLNKGIDLVPLSSIDKNIDETIIQIVIFKELKKKL